MCARIDAQRAGLHNAMNKIHFFFHTSDNNESKPDWNPWRSVRCCVGLICSGCVTFLAINESNAVCGAIVVVVVVVGSVNVVCGAYVVGRVYVIGCAYAAGGAFTFATATGGCCIYPVPYLAPYCVPVPYPATTPPPGCVASVVAAPAAVPAPTRVGSQLRTPGGRSK